MKLLKLAVISFIMSFQIVNAQIGFTYPSFSGYGYSKTINNVSNIGSVNPAAINRFNLLNAGISYQYDTKTNSLIYYMKTEERYFSGIPLSAGIVIPVKNLRLGFGVDQMFNARTLTSLKNVDNATIHYDFKKLVMRYSVIGAYNFHNLFYNNDRFTLGVNVNALNAILYNRNVRSNQTDIVYSYGIMYSYPTAMYNYTDFSLSFEKGIKQSDDIRKYDEDYHNAFNYIGNNSIISTPDKINFGFDVNAYKLLKITTGISYVYWSQVDDTRDDNIEVSCSGIYKINPSVSASLGFLYSNYSFKGMGIYVDELDFNTLYLTTGLVLKFKTLDLELSVADSHVSVGEMRKETIVKLFAGFYI